MMQKAAPGGGFTVTDAVGRDHFKPSC